MAQPQPGEYGNFFGRYVNQITAKNLQEAVTTYSHPLTYFFVNLPDEKADFSYAPGKWTLKDMLQHLIDTERIMQYRMMRIARKDTTPLPGFEENDYALHAAAYSRSFVSLKEELIALRKSTDLLIQSLTDDMLANVGTASGHAITANALGYIIFGHLAHHKTIVEERYL